MIIGTSLKIENEDEMCSVEDMQKCFALRGGMIKNDSYYKGGR